MKRRSLQRWPLQQVLHCRWLALMMDWRRRLLRYPLRRALLPCHHP